MMSSLPLFAILGVCTLGSLSHAVDLRQSLSKEEGVYFRRLANGVSSLIQCNSFPSKQVCLRFVMGSGSHENALFSLDTSMDNSEDIETFFRLCHERCCQWMGSDVSSFLGLQGGGFSSNGDFLLSGCRGENMAMIAVGDFSESAMQAKIEEYFGGLSFGMAPGRSRAPIQIGLSPFPSGVAVHIDYSVHPKKLVTHGDLKESWMQIFAQDLLQQRLERLTRVLREDWVHPRARFLFPVHGFVLASESVTPDVLALLLWEIEQIKLEGFNENEFFTLQQNMIHRLQNLGKGFFYSESDKIASFYADALHLGRQHFCYKGFTEASEEIVKNMEFADLQPYVDHLLLDANRFIHVRYPQNYLLAPLTVSDIEEIAEKVSSLAEMESEGYYDEDDIMLLDQKIPGPVLPKAEILKCSLQGGSARAMPISQMGFMEEELFSNLPLSHSDRSTISYVISNMANKNIFELAFDKRKMEEKGKKINHVHPLRFIGFIFSDSELKRAMKRIKKSSFKWDALIDGFAKRMKEESSKDNLLIYVSGFAQQVNANPEKITYYIHKKDWEGIVRYLLQN